MGTLFSVVHPKEITHSKQRPRNMSAIPTKTY